MLRSLSAVRFVVVDGRVFRSRAGFLYCARILQDALPVLYWKMNSTRRWYERNAPAKAKHVFCAPCSALLDELQCVSTVVVLFSSPPPPILYVRLW